MMRQRACRLSSISILPLSCDQLAFVCCQSLSQRLLGCGQHNLLQLDQSEVMLLQASIPMCRLLQLPSCIHAFGNFPAIDAAVSFAAGPTLRSFACNFWIAARIMLNYLVLWSLQ